MEQTLVILKNDCIQRKLMGKVLDRILYETPFNISQMIKIVPTLQDVQSHYAEHEGKDFFQDVCQRMSGKEVILIVLEGKNVISEIRSMVGKTDCSEKGTIRGDWGTGVKGNLIHASANREDAKREINVWTTYLSRC